MVPASSRQLGPGGRAVVFRRTKKPRAHMCSPDDEKISLLLAVLGVAGKRATVQ
jgi:hypothetical protein